MVDPQELERAQASVLRRCLRTGLGSVLLALGVALSAPGWGVADELPGAAQTSVLAKEDINPEAATGLVRRVDVHADQHMVVSANPLASRAGLEMLEAGGSAVDAAIAMQLVLGLVEPQSSGLGGGGFAVVFDANTEGLRTYDGRETAPGTVRDDLFMHASGPIAFHEAVNSGLSVGVPGMVAMLGRLHERHGVLNWQQLFRPAIELAESGFHVSPRLHTLLASNQALRDSPSAANYFYDGALRPWPVGHRLRNPEYAAVLRVLAQAGPSAFYFGAIPAAIVQAVREHSRPGALHLDDFAAYRVREREPVCAEYRRYQVCGAPPPSSGPLAVLQMLGLLKHTPLSRLDPTSAEAIHYFSEAGRLAFADRDHYVADPDVVAVPVAGMLDAGYLRQRADLIQPQASLGQALAGVPPGAAPRGTDATQEIASTTHLVAMDAQGGAISMTSSVESAFGNKVLVKGFLLNNQLTDFSLTPYNDQGQPVANRVAAGKRPRSSMAPMMVLADGKPAFLIGSPGGSAIINFVAKTLLGVLDWNLSVQQAIDLPNYGSRNRATELETGRFSSEVMTALREKGHEVREREFPSGLHGIRRLPTHLQGGADPRREGLALGR